jgi:STAS-like domain of unknown function (DUF4325)
MKTFAQPVTVPMTTISLADRFGPALVGRLPAMQVRQEVEDAAARGETVFVDFEDVVMVSPSFADEMFAKLDERLVNEGLVTLINVAPLVANIGELVRRTRAV